MADITRTATLHGSDYILLIVYMLLMICVGVLFTGRGRNAEDFLLGGRSIAWWLAGISYVMTLLSTISMVAVPGVAYSQGLTLGIQTLILPIVSIGTFQIFMRFYFRAGTFTPFDYLERRFDGRVRTLAAVFYWLTRVIYLGLALYATSKVFEGACGWTNLYYTILLAGGIGVLYTMLGGLHAVAWTDFIQFVVLVGGLGVLLVKVLAAVPGGAWGVLTYAFAHGHGLPEVTDPAGGFFSLSPFVPVSLWGLILLMTNDHLFYNSSDQMAIQRLLSTSSYQEAKRSLYASLWIQVPLLLGLFFIGLAMFAFYRQVAPAEAPAQGDHALYQFIGTRLPAPLPGLMIAAMLAAVMSTVSGGFNSLATVATIDLYQRLFAPAATQREQVAFSRYATLAVGVLSIATGMLLARVASESMIKTSLVWLSLVAGLPPVFLLGVLSRRATAGHALVALGMACTVTAGMIVYYQYSQGTVYALSFLYVCVPGPVLALLTSYAVTRFSPPLAASRLASLTLWTLTAQEGDGHQHSLPVNLERMPDR